MFVEYDEYYEEKHENGVVKVTGQYKNGVKEGAWVEYDDKGYLILPIKLFINGKEQWYGHNCVHNYSKICDSWYF